MSCALLRFAVAVAHAFSCFFSIPPIASSHVHLKPSIFQFFVIFAAQFFLTGLASSIDCTGPHQTISMFYEF